MHVNRDEKPNKTRPYFSMRSSPRPSARALTVSGVVSVRERGSGFIILPSYSREIPRVTWRYGIWQAKDDREGCSRADVGSEVDGRHRVG